MHLTKHHGLGNDFLVLAGGQPDPALARAVCDRHRGVGADGLLLLDPSPGEGSDIGMVLLNADGSRAEMSGNGIGCLVQAAVLGGHTAGPSVRVRTDAGLREVELADLNGPGSRTHLATAAMGEVEVGDEAAAAAWVGDRVLAALLVGVGNPHLVLHVADDETLHDREWLVEVGQKANVEVEGGINVEVVRSEGAGALAMDVYERGVGLTDACGTGAVATAAAARRWGLAGDRATVSMRGGPVEVALDGDAASLVTTIAFVATIDFPWS